ncbi:MAG: GBS Bsp-like repeat-containing protein [Oscillospiraceae bacterium]|nr:GBS Bsp-like repeat-containing protein [Oscillospiraceae bacterium]
MKRITRLVSLVTVLCLCLMLFPILSVEAEAANVSVQFGNTSVSLDYGPGDYFTVDHGPCRVHQSNTLKCYGYDIYGASQCFGYARYVQHMLFQKDSGNNPSEFYHVSGAEVAYGSLTAEKLKTIMLSGNVKPGAHIRTKGSQHSMIVTQITSTGFSIIQCNGRNNNEYSNYEGCRIGTFTYTWESYVADSYGQRGIDYIEMPKNYSIDPGTIPPAPTPVNHSADTRYHAYLPFSTYALAASGNIAVYDEYGNQLSDRYITAETDLCSILAIYTDGWCQVKYPSCREASGYFTAYVQTSNFISNASPATVTATSRSDVYRRATGSDTIGSVFFNDSCLKVGEANGKYQVIYPVQGGHKMGWVPQSAFILIPNPPTHTVYKPPCKAFTISGGRVTVYDGVNGSPYPTSGNGAHYIDGDTDLCTIEAFYDEGWCKVNYPSSSGSFTAYAPISTFVVGGITPYTWTADRQRTTYRRSTGSETVSNGGTSYVSPNDVCIVVSIENGRMQLEYPLDGGGYKLGWVDVPETTKPAITNVSVYDLSPSGYTISCTATDASGLREVYFPTWTEANGQDDVRWDTGTKNGNTYTYRVNISDHKNERGVYHTHIYAYDIFGNFSVYGSEATVPQPDNTKPSISNVKISNLSSSGFTISCTATDASGIQAVLFPTWTEANGQDDLVPSWRTNDAVVGTRNGDTFTYQVYTSAHNNESGKYITHIHAIDHFGNDQAYYTGTTVPVDVQDISVNKGALRFSALGQSETLIATVSPSNATDPSVIWSSSNAAVATVSNGTVTAVGYGNATVTAKAHNGVSTICLVTVEQPKLTGIAVKTLPNVTQYELGAMLNTEGLVLTATYSDGSTSNVTSGFTCSPTVLNTVGEQTITVTYGGKTTSFQVTVLTPHPKVSNVSCSIAQATPGALVDVTLLLSNCDEFMNLSLEVGYDAAALSLTKVTNHVTGSDFVASETLGENPYALTWTSASGNPYLGNLVTLTFAVSQSAAGGVYPISVSYYKGVNGQNVDGVNVNYDSNFQSIGLIYASGAIEVSAIPKDAPAVGFGTAFGVPGGKVLVPITIYNNPGIISLSFDVTYDESVLTLESVSDEGKLGGSLFANKLSSPYRMTWGNDLSTEDSLDQGVIATLVFRVKETAREDTYPIRISNAGIEAYNVGMVDVVFASSAGSVTVRSVLLGDVNSDGKVDGKDRTVLARYLAHWVGFDENSLDLRAADVNADGVVNSKDRTVLARHLANWEGYESLPYCS